MKLTELLLPGFLTTVIAYLLGSLSFSILFTKLFDKKDIRTMGSGNAGATNVLRSVGPKAAAFTFVFDFLKGVISVLLGKLIFSQFFPGSSLAPELVQYGAYIAGFFCVMGHLFPVYFGFRGGKGILTTAAIIALIDWRIFLIVIAIFIVVFVCSKIVSLGSIIAAAAFPVVTFCINYFVEYSLNGMSLRFVGVTTVTALVMAVIVVARHHGNIKRIKAGTEKKISIKKKES